MLREDKERFVVLTKHGNIHIIVPRNEALVIDRAKKRPCMKEIFQSILPANLVDVLHGGKEYLMQFQVSIVVGHGWKRSFQ